MDKSIIRRIEALSGMFESDSNIPVSICKRTTGETVEYDGLTVLQPFLDGELSEIRCNDPDIVNLLKSMAADDPVTIDIL